MVDADVFVGLSVGNTVTPEMVKSMAKRPIVFAMANPDPEITYDAATAVREDLIMATGSQRFSKPGKQCIWAFRLYFAAPSTFVQRRSMRQ